MAESYQSFQSSGPNIDVNLFLNALSTGIAAGNAQKTTAGAIFSGINEGIKSGISTVQGIQGISAANQDAELKDIQIRKAGTPEQQEQDADIERQLRKAQADAAELRVKAGQISEIPQAEAEAQKARTQIDDFQALKKLTSILSQPQSDPAGLESALSDPQIAGAIQRNPEQAQSVAAQLQGRVSPAAYDQFVKGVDAAKLQQQRINLAIDAEKRKQDYAIKNDEAFTEAQGSLTGLSGFREAADLGKNPTFDYTKLQLHNTKDVVINNGQLQKDLKTGGFQKPLLDSKDDTGVLTYGDKVIESNISKEDAQRYGKDLATYKRGAASKNYPTSGEESTSTTDIAAPASGSLGLASRNPIPSEGAPSPVSTPGAVNDNIIAAAKQKNDAAYAQAQKSGQGESYQALVTKGQAIASAAPTKAPAYIQTPQSVPVPAGTPAITKPAENYEGIDKAIDNLTAEQKLSDIMGVDKKDVSFNVDKKLKGLSAETVKNVNAVPALQDRSAFIKGLVAVESKGNPFAVSGKNAGGIMQIMEGTAPELGLSSEDRFNPEKAVPAGIEYLQRKYNENQKALRIALNAQGLNIEPDPRFILASYNGGFRDIKRGINKGITTWDEMKQYLKTVKGTDENIEYPDKVLSASIPFIKGGNASDDDFVRTLLNFGIVDLNV